MSLVPPGQGLGLNCAGCTDQPLRSFHHEKFSLVLFDEASTQLVLLYKKLFQGPNCEVCIGMSATIMYSYSVYLNETLLVVASNSWAEELKALLDNDR